MDLDQPDIIQKWRDARQRLDCAMQDYLDLTTTVRTAISSFAHPNLMDSTAVEADRDIPSMPSRIKSLHHTQLLLKQIRNQSTSLSPLNKLPLDILRQIFILCTWWFSCSAFDPSLVGYSRHHAPAALFTLTHVCKHWRTVILGDPTFWSHVDISIVSDSRKMSRICQRAAICLERAKKLPSCLHIDGSTHCDKKGFKIMTDYLRPYLSAKLRSLYLINLRNPHQLDDLFCLCLTNAQPDSIRTLVVWQDGIDWTNGPTYKLTLPSSTSSQPDVELLLLSVRVLRTNGAHFPWNCAVYHSLIVLQIGNLTQRDSPTLQQMLHILSACPQLHTLQLQAMNILPSADTPLEPVVLRELQTLSFPLIELEDLTYLLPLISTESNGVSVRVALDVGDGHAGKEVCSFLARTNVTKLHVDIPDDIPSAMSYYLSAVPELHTLMIQFGYRSFRKEETHDFFLYPLASPPSIGYTVPCPRLHTLQLYDGIISTKTMKRVVVAHPLLKELLFGGCELRPLRAELVRWLEPLVEVVRWGGSQNIETILGHWLMPN